MVSLILLALSSAVCQSEDDFLVRLNDGTTINTSFGNSELKVKTEYGDMKVSLKEIKLLRSTKDGIVIKTDKSSLLCTSQDELTLKTRHGPLTVKRRC